MRGTVQLVRPKQDLQKFMSALQLWYTCNMYSTILVNCVPTAVTMMTLMFESNTLILLFRDLTITTSYV